MQIRVQFGELSCEFFRPPRFGEQGFLHAWAWCTLEYHSRPSIDALFESAADAYGARLLGVILTGASADGAEGLDAIRRAGGLTVVQQPEEAYAALMIESALARGPVDFVLPLQEIAALFTAVEGGPGAAAPGSARP